MKMKTNTRTVSTHDQQVIFKCMCVWFCNIQFSLSLFLSLSLSLFYVLLTRTRFDRRLNVFTNCWDCRQNCGNHRTQLNREWKIIIMHNYRRVLMYVMWRHFKMSSEILNQCDDEKKKKEEIFCRFFLLLLFFTFCFLLCTNNKRVYGDDNVVCRNIKHSYFISVITHSFNRFQS